MPISEIQDGFEKRIKTYYKRLVSDPRITREFELINESCQSEMSTYRQIPLTNQSTAIGKNYVVFKNPANTKTLNSRPVNIDLYNKGNDPDPSDSTKSKVQVFWENVKAHQIQKQSSVDITSALYTIAMNYCCCSDVIPSVKNNSGKFFEVLIGHLFSVHLGIEPSTQLNAVELDGESIVVPTDFIFDLGPSKPKFHVPVKTSTRERVVEVWAQQRILDGAFGVGRFLCLLTCIGETNFRRSDMSVGLTCVPNQWMNYQLFISQIKRAYYLDVPDKYNELNDRFPPIHVKPFGDFFHESDELAE